jgi:hypothetical protein
MNFSDEITFAETLNSFNMATSIIITIIGVFGNSISLYIFLSKDFRHQSMNRWLAALTLTDLICVLLVWPQNVPSTYEPTPFNCKFVMFIVLHTYTLCAMLITITSIDRMLAVVYPTRFLIRKKIWCQATVLLLTCIFTAVVNSPYLVYYDVVQQDNQTICHYNTPFVNFYLDIFLLFIYLVIPVAIIMTCTIAISHRLSSLKFKSGRLTNSHKDTYLTKTLFGACLFFFVMNAPVNIGVIFTDYNIFFGHDINENIFIYNCLNFFSLLHNSCPFLVYLICNKLFRMKFFSLFVFKKRVHPTNLSLVRLVKPIK